MTIHQFKLFCINLVTKNEGKMLSDVIKGSIDDTILSINNISFYIDQKRSSYMKMEKFFCLKFVDGYIYVWGENYNRHDWMKITKFEYNDLI